MTMQLVFVPEYMHGTLVFKFCPCDFYGTLSFQPMETQEKLLQPKVAACWTHILFTTVCLACVFKCTAEYLHTYLKTKHCANSPVAWCSTTTVVPGQFDPNYIVFRNVEIFKKYFFLKENKESNVIFENISFFKNGFLSMRPNQIS